MCFLGTRDVPGPTKAPICPGLPCWLPVLRCGVLSPLRRCQSPSRPVSPSTFCPPACSPAVAEPTMAWPRPSSYCSAAVCGSKKRLLECWWHPCIVQQCGTIAAILEVERSSWKQMPFLDASLLRPHQFLSSSYSLQFCGMFWGCQRGSLLPHGAPHPSRPDFHLLLSITMQAKVSLEPGNLVETEPGWGKPKNLMLGMPRPNGSSCRSCALCERTSWREPHGPIEASAEQILLMGILRSYGGNLKLGVGLKVGTHSYIKASRGLISA